MPSKVSEELKPNLINATNESQSKTSGKKGRPRITRNETFDDLSSIETKDSCNEWICSQCSHLNHSSNPKCVECSSKRVTTSSDDKKPTKKSSKPKSVVTPEICSTKTKTTQLKFKYQTKPSAHKLSVISNIRSVKTKTIESQFIDDTFPPITKSLYFKGGQNKGPVTQWLRPNQIIGDDDDNPSLQWRIFRNPKPTDICQGLLGNCWFVSALSVLAQKPGTVKKLFISPKISGEGYYEIRLFKAGRPVIVTIDDNLPCDQYGRLVYSKAKRRQLWVPLIEKAAAKLYGSYEALDGGWGWEGLAMLTGKPCETIKLHPQIDVDFVWDQLLKNRRSRFLMATSTNAPDNDQLICLKVGLVYRHAYSILDVRAINGNRLIHLRNPHGGYLNWNGDWSENSHLWTPELRKELMPNGLSEGMFWIEFKDFLKYFGSVNICKFRPRWCEAEISGFIPTNANQTQNMTAVVLTAVKQTKVELVLHQRGIRGLPPKEWEKFDLCLAVFSWNGSKLGKMQSCSVRKFHDFVTCSLSLKAGVYIVVNMAFNHFHKRRQIVKQFPEYLLAVHSVTPLEVKGMIPPPYILADALIAITIAKGERQEIYDEKGIYGAIYFLSKDWAGLSTVVENYDPNLNLRVICFCSPNEDIVSTREVLKIEDFIPPLHKQLVMHLTDKFPEEDGNSPPIRMEVMCEPVAKQDKTKGEHWPPLDKSDLKLHSPRSL